MSTFNHDFMFALRTTVAGLAALFTAMWLQLDVPRWAMWTVLIISPPVHGNALRKTVSRIIGTLVGCVLGVAVVGLFPQDRIGFYLTFSAWLAGCAYWATLKRGFVSYGATLAAFTSAIIAANVAAAPQDVFPVAISRGSATMVGVLFALLASGIAAGSDDVPGELADRVCSVAAKVLEWAINYLERHLSSYGAEEFEDAPFTADILGLDDCRISALAERPALNWVNKWIAGLPTALLSLQSAVLSIGRAIRTGTVERANVQKIVQTLVGVREILKPGVATLLPALPKQAAMLSKLRSDHANEAERTPALAEIACAFEYLQAAFEAILVLKKPLVATLICYPAPKFLAPKERAKINFRRTIVGMLLGFVIWDATAWTDGPLFMVNVAVALVIFVSLDDPVAGNKINLLGTVSGGVVAIAAKFFLLPLSNDPVWLAFVLFLLVFVAVFAETRTKYANLGIFYINALLVLLEPTNPQGYDLSRSLNSLAALVVAYTFVPLIFIAIGTPISDQERIDKLLNRMLARLRTIKTNPPLVRDQQLAWETEMYDALQQLQAATNDPRDRARAVDYLLAGQRTFDLTTKPRKTAAVFV